MRNESKHKTYGNIDAFRNNVPFDAKQRPLRLEAHFSSSPISTDAMATLGLFYSAIAIYMNSLLRRQQVQPQKYIKITYIDRRKLLSVLYRG
jgi:membrane-anchored protein YejM (alkaline phosphatase superfamily)